MQRYGYLLLVLSLCFAANIRAQEWSAQDSAWLRRVLSGKEELKLNDATRKAIREGTLISTDPAPGKLPMLSAPPELPVSKIVESIAQPKTQKKDMTELPPSVYILDGLGDGDLLQSDSSNILHFNTASTNSVVVQKWVVELKWLETATSRKATVNDPTAVRSGGITIDAEDLLRTIFQPSYRAKKRNRKHATARYTYNQY
ncbi:MAG: DUF4858 domain-containing protein [Tannerella sp.]|jgi:hypothetical protein|nr:DUF4858 domain-containing protein [Tannerella sp.]